MAARAATDASHDDLEHISRQDMRNAMTREHRNLRSIAMPLFAVLHFLGLGITSAAAQDASLMLRGGYDGPPNTPARHRPPHRYTPRFRVVRGASWKHCDPVSAAVTYRMIEDPLTRRDDLGFRICRTP